MSNVDECKAVATLSNSAKLLAGYMKATGVYHAKELSEALCIPIRTIQRLKLEIACATDGASSGNGARATCAISAVDGAASSANSAMGGVSSGAISATGGASQKEIPPIPPKEKLHYLETTVEINNSGSSSRARVAAAVAEPTIDYDLLESQLVKACNGALANPANAQGLLDLSTPIMWLKSGADLEADILPTLRAIGKRDHGKGISHWNYFTKAVSQATARRARGLPEVEPAPAAAPKGSRQERSAAFHRAMAELSARKQLQGAPV